MTPPGRGCAVDWRTTTSFLKCSREVAIWEDGSEPVLALCSSGATFVVAGAAEIVAKVDRQGEDGKT